MESAQEEHAREDKGPVWDLIRARSYPEVAKTPLCEENLLSTITAAFFCHPRRGWLVSDSLSTSACTSRSHARTACTKGNGSCLVRAPTIHRQM